MALDNHTAVPKPPIFSSTEDNTDFPYDITIFKLKDDILNGSSKCFIDLSDDYPKLSEYDLGMAVGFPGHIREDIDGIKVAHPVWHLVAHCQLSSDRRICLHVSIEFNGPIINIGGLSGGPLFHVFEDGSFEFVGIINGQRDPYDVFQEKRKYDVTILGFPLNCSVLKKMLQSC